MWNTCSRARGLLPATFLLISFPISGCITQSLPMDPRPGLPLPADLEAEYALQDPIAEDFLVPLDENGRIFRGSLSCGGERTEFNLLLPEGRAPAPFLLCLQILAGGKDLMWYVAQDMAKRGHAVAWIERLGSAMRQGQRGPEVEDLFRRTVIQNRILLHWGRQQAWALKGETALLGISTGGLVGSVVLALEPELKAGILVLAGADLPGLICHSSEGRVQRWRRWRREADGLGPGGLERELCREIRTEPGRFGPFVPSQKVLLVSAVLDRVVPRRNQDWLWESLGRPERLLLPLSHYSAVLGIHPILNHSAVFLESRLGAPGPAGPTH